MYSVFCILIPGKQKILAKKAAQCYTVSQIRSAHTDISPCRRRADGTKLLY